MKAYVKTRKYVLAKALNLAIMVALVVGFSLWATDAQAQNAEVQEQIDAAERASHRGAYPADGIFTGEAEGFGGPVKMQVTIADGYIEAVDILDASHEDEAWLDMAMGLPDQIVEAQSADIDVVSGATFTSAGILNGAADALRQSLEGAAS